MALFCQISCFLDNLGLKSHFFDIFKKFSKWYWIIEISIIQQKERVGEAFYRQISSFLSWFLLKKTLFSFFKKKFDSVLNDRNFEYSTEGISSYSIISAKINFFSWFGPIKALFQICSKNFPNLSILVLIRGIWQKKSCQNT